MRLTKRDAGGNAVMACDNCEIKYREGRCSKQLCRNALIDTLAAYEDAEEQGLLVRLPCKVGDTAWFYLNEDRGDVRKGVYQGTITELKAIQRIKRDAPLFLAFIEFEYHDPWYSYRKMSKSEMACSFGSYGNWVQFYLSYEEATGTIPEVEHG